MKRERHAQNKGRMGWGRGLLSGDIPSAVESP